LLQLHSSYNRLIGLIIDVILVTDCSFTSSSSSSNLCLYIIVQVEAEALFQLLLSFSQKSCDDLHILDLVEGDKPLMPLVCSHSQFVVCHCVNCLSCCSQELRTTYGWPQAPDTRATYAVLVKFSTSSYFY